MRDKIEEGEKIGRGDRLQSADGRFSAYITTERHGGSYKLILYRHEATRVVETARRSFFRRGNHPELWVRDGRWVMKTDWSERYWHQVPRSEYPALANPVILLENWSGNLALWERNQDEGWERARYAIDSRGRHEAGVDIKKPIAHVRTGQIQVAGADTILVNELGEPICISDEDTAVICNNGDSLGIATGSGPGTLRISVGRNTYNYEPGQSQDAIAASVDCHCTPPEGAIVRLRRGSNPLPRRHDDIVDGLVDPRIPTSFDLPDDEYDWTDIDEDGKSA